MASTSSLVERFCGDDVDVDVDIDVESRDDVACRRFLSGKASSSFPVIACDNIEHQHSRDALFLLYNARRFPGLSCFEDYIHDATRLI